MKNFKNIPNNSYKVRFSWEVANAEYFTNFWDNSRLVDFSGFSLIHKDSLIPTSVIVSSTSSQDGQVATVDSILEQGLQNTFEYLSKFRFDAGYTQKLETAFGNNLNWSVANQIFDKLAQGDFSDVPSIEIVNRNDINGANGAFAISTGKIYIAAEFISQNAQNLDAIVAVLLEEYGHYVDSQINTKDATGDEGDIFAWLVQGKSLSESALAVLQAEDDSATVTLNGQVVDIEMNSGTTIFNPKTFVSNNFGVQQGWSAQNTYPRQLGDVDGDGHADIVGFGDRDIWVSRGQSNGTFGNSFVGIHGAFTHLNYWTSFDAYPRLLGDVDGDGKADIVGFGDRDIWVSRGQGNGTFGNPFVGIHGAFTHLNYWTSFDAYPRLLGDVDGDGKADIVGFGDNTTFISFGQADGKFSQPSSQHLGLSVNDTWRSFNQYPRLLGDVNGDGKADIVAFASAGVEVALSKGREFEPKRFVLNNFGVQQGWVNQDTYPRQLRDVNGDGRVDIIGFGNNATFISFSKADGTFSQPFSQNLGLSVNDTWRSFNQYPRQLGDVNGDGRADIVAFASAGVEVAFATSDYNDVFEVRSVNHIYKGGNGIDTLDVSKSGSGYVIRLDGSNQGSAVSGNINHQLFSIENVIGSNFNDSLYGDGQANRLEGNGGNDLIEGRSGNDILSGGLGNDRNDTLDGGADSDRVIETGDVNFSLRVVIPNDINNTHQLTGLGTDTLRNIETVELRGGASNNTLDASLATIKVELKGLGGNDTLTGGSGDDTLVGGQGSNNLWGGKGRDTFVIDRSSTSLYSGDIQIIQDFERTVDSIDIAGAELRHITFERNTVENYTLIKENGVDRAKVLGTTRIDSTDLSKFRTIYQPLPANEVGNLDQVIRNWAQNYAKYLGKELGSDVSLTGVSLTQGVVKYSPLTSINLPNGDIQVMGTYINKSNVQQTSPTLKYTQRASATSNVTEGTSYSKTTTSAIQHGWKISVGYDYTVKAKMSGKVLGLGPETEVSKSVKVSGEGFGNYSYSGSFTDGGSKTYSNIKVEENSVETTYSYTAPAFSVTEFKAISNKTTYRDNYEMDIAIGGDVKFRLGDKDPNTSNLINLQDVVIPVALILEQYNPEIFYSQDTNYQTYTLLNGDQIVYNPNLKFNVKGTIESQSIYGTQVVTDTTYDILLSGGQNYQAQPGKERLWVATGQLPLAGTAPVKITGFSDGLDKIGFANVPQVMGLGSLERWDSGTSGFIGIGTGDQRRALAELVGISATALDASDFIFNTTGTAIG
ncbi:MULTISPECIES: FG-GAP-like repeat-containing protein [unclassified Tolypothrix]|nr:MULTISPECIES: FG-GAP-like repeat-containing protein [unclassified Tolypothrix]MBE9084515.1 VCBS repeat-containing protein [Tolypothrix sp. LEGE 11397]UYD29170.1 VCBS repeat-containing protein [Tolypothrix sp. PCC 7712]UYD34917.1 VCBS repeat-containing protein [Tolypothrix sp. PCC 7601]